MITGSYYDNDLLRFVTDFYLAQISKPELINFFDIYYSDNIQEDIKKYNKGSGINVLADGVTILPSSKDEVIIILINEEAPKEIHPQYIIHELCHMYDFILFANKYCHKKIQRIRKNKYFSIFKCWSEFHVQLYIMPYYYAMLACLSEGKNDYTETFKKEIEKFYYEKYNEKLLNKDEVTIVDIMYYLGEIAMCNQNDKNKYYKIDERVLEKYPFIDNLYSILEKCLTFESFCCNLKILYQELNL